MKKERGRKTMQGTTITQGNIQGDIQGDIQGQLTSHQYSIEIAKEAVLRVKVKPVYPMFGVRA